MNPDIDLRLKSVEKALTDVIARAVPDDKKLARDQINLVVGHLQIIGKHWKYALRYELGTMDALRELAADLREHADDEARSALDNACAAVDAIDRSEFDDVQSAQRSLSAAIAAVIAAGHRNTPMPVAMRERVLAYFALAAPRERIWHQASGLDPDAAALVELESIF